MTDQELRTQLWDYVYGLLEPDEATALEVRIKSDPRLARMYSETRLEADLLAGAARLEHPKIPLSTRTAAAAVRGAGSSTKKSGRDWKFQWANWGAGLAAALLLGLFVYGSRVPMREVVEVVPTELPSTPEQLAHRMAPEHAMIVAEISGPAVVPAGLSNKFLISTRDLHDAPQTADLLLQLFDKEGNTEFTADVSTDVNGLAEVTVPGSALRSDGVLVVSSDRTSALPIPPVRAPVHVAEEAYLAYLEVDRPVVKPGETLFYRTVVLGENSRTERDLAEAEFEVLNPQGEVLPGSKSKGITEHGVAAGEAVIPSNAPEGTYDVIVRSPRGEFADQRLEVLVQREPVLAGGVGGGTGGEHLAAASGGSGPRSEVDEKQKTAAAKFFAADRLASGEAGDKVRDGQKADLLRENSGKSNSGKSTKDVQALTDTAPHRPFPSEPRLMKASPPPTAAKAGSPPGAIAGVKSAAPADAKMQLKAIRETPSRGLAAASSDNGSADAPAPLGKPSSGNFAGGAEAKPAEEQFGFAVEGAKNGLTLRLPAQETYRRYVVETRRGDIALKSEVALERRLGERSTSDKKKMESREAEAAQLEISLPPEMDGSLSVVVRDADNQTPVFAGQVYRVPQQRIAVALGDQPTSYAPGQEVDLRLATTDEDGSQISAVLGVRVVNDAYLASAAETFDGELTQLSNGRNRASDVDDHRAVPNDDDERDAVHRKRLPNAFGAAVVPEQESAQSNDPTVVKNEPAFARRATERLSREMKREELPEQAKGQSPADAADAADTPTAPTEWFAAGPQVTMGTNRAEVEAAPNEVAANLQKQWNAPVSGLSVEQSELRHDRPPAGAAAGMDARLIARRLLLGGLLGLIVVGTILVLRLPVKPIAWVPAMLAAAACFLLGVARLAPPAQTTIALRGFPETAAPALSPLKRQSNERDADVKHDAGWNRGELDEPQAGQSFGRPNPAMPPVLTDAAKELETVGKQTIASRPAGPGNATSAAEENKNSPGENSASRTQIAEKAADFAREKAAAADETAPAAEANGRKRMSGRELAPAAVKTAPGQDGPAMPPATLLWNPRLITNEAGEAHIRFKLPEQPGRYRLFIQAHANGRVGQAETVISSIAPVVEAAPAAPPASPAAPPASPAAPPASPAKPADPTVESNEE